MSQILQTLPLDYTAIYELKFNDGCVYYEASERNDFETYVRDMLSRSSHVSLACNMRGQAWFEVNQVAIVQKFALDIVLASIIKQAIMTGKCLNNDKLAELEHQAQQLFAKRAQINKAKSVIDDNDTIDTRAKRTKQTKQTKQAYKPKKQDKPWANKLLVVKGRIWPSIVKVANVYDKSYNDIDRLCQTSNDWQYADTQEQAEQIRAEQVAKIAEHAEAALNAKADNVAKSASKYKTPGRPGRKVSIDGKVYDRLLDAANALDIKPNVLYGRITSKSERWSTWKYID